MKGIPTFGDLERCALRPGNVHSADGWESVLKPVVARYKNRVSRIYFRGDAGFANPDIRLIPLAPVPQNAVTRSYGAWIAAGALAE